MDNSKDYTLMCYKAGKYLLPFLKKDSDNCASSEENFGFIKDVKGLIWLPRQDQLLDIFGSFDKQWKAIYGLVKLAEECGNSPIMLSNELAYWGQFRSIEQLWLSFLMYKKYNKIWENENWRIK